jgi:hypothetical protein
MPVTLSTDDSYGWTILALFDVNPALISKAQTLGVKIDTSSTGLYQVKVKEVLCGTVTVKGQAITFAKNQQLGPASKASFTGQFEAALKKAIAVAEVDGPDAAQAAKNKIPQKFPFVPQSPSKAVVGNEPVPTETPNVPESGLKFPFKPVKNKLGNTAAAVPLYKANSAYQAVTATSPGSIYFVFAVMEGLNLAVKMQGTKFSVRAEGPKLTEYKEALGDFSMEHNKTYMSGHFKADSDAMVKKALGAIVGRIGFQHVKEVANLNVIMGNPE